MLKTPAFIFCACAAVLAPAVSGAASQRPAEGALKTGDTAPDFSLKTLDGKATIKLSTHRGKRPVVLVFGSYT